MHFAGGTWKTTKEKKSWPLLMIVAGCGSVVRAIIVGLSASVHFDGD